MYLEVVDALRLSTLRVLKKRPAHSVMGGLCSRFNDYIDNDNGPFEMLEIPLIASEALYRMDFQTYRAALVQFKQEQQTAAEDDHDGSAGYE